MNRFFLVILHFIHVIMFEIMALLMWMLIVGNVSVFFVCINVFMKKAIQKKLNQHRRGFRHLSDLGYKLILLFLHVRNALKSLVLTDLIRSKIHQYYSYRIVLINTIFIAWIRTQIFHMLYDFVPSIKL